jgi:hypothetical protein
MHARIRFRPPPLAALAVLACSLALAATARAQFYPWPVNGAPLCNGAGDQHRPFAPSIDCDLMALSYVHSVPGADSFVTRTLGYVPPTGDCATIPQPLVDATGVTELSAAQVTSNIIAIGMPSPGCVGPPTMAQGWLQGAGAASQVVVHDPAWFQGGGRVVADDGDFVRHHPGLAPSGFGYPDTALVVVWSDERTGVPQIRAQRVTWNGVRTWGPTGIVIAPTGAPQSEPEIARLGDGSSLVVWSDARAGGSDVYALRLLPNGSPAPGWPSGGLVLEDRAEISGAPRLVNSRSYGPRFVAWDESGPRFGGGRSVVVCKLNSDGTPASGPLGVVLCTSATVDRLQDVTAVGPEMIAVWTDTRSASPGNPTDLYAQWLKDAVFPEPRWLPDGLPICTATGRQDAARVSAPSSYAPGYAAFAWEDHRGADADIYATIRSVNGALPCCLWHPDGLPATSAPGDQTSPLVGVGNSGGCFVAWEDARDLGTTGLDVYAQAFSNEGDKLDVRPPGLPRSLMLGPPRPNPMRSATVFVLELPRAGAVTVDVLDLAGRRVRVLAVGMFPAGNRELTFDGRDDAGHELPPGMYSVRARIGGEVSTRMLMRIH